MKKFLFSAVACVALAGSAFAGNEIVDVKSLDAGKTGPTVKESEQMTFRGICKGSAVVIDGMGHIIPVQMGKPDVDIITDSAIDCLEMFNNFIAELSLSFKVVVSESDYNAL